LPELSEVDRLVAACSRGERNTAEGLLAKHPGVRTEITDDHYIAFHQAAERNDLRALERCWRAGSTRTVPTRGSARRRCIRRRWRAGPERGAVLLGAPARRCSSGPRVQGASLHRRECSAGLADPRVGTVRVEPARQHRFERPQIIALGRLMKRDVVIVGDFGAHPGCLAAASARVALAATAGGDEPIDFRQLRHRAVREQPVRHRAIPIQLGDRIGRAPVSALPLDVGPSCDHRLGQRHIPRARHHVQRRLAVLGEHHVRSAPCSSSHITPSGCDSN